MFDSIFYWLKNNYSLPSGLFIGIFFIFFTIILLLDPFLQGLSISNIYRLSIYFLLEILWLCSWYFLRNHYPKNEKGKIGIIISIRTENDKQAKRISIDLVEKINQELIRAGLEKEIKTLIIGENKVKRLNVAIEKFVSGSESESDGVLELSKRTSVRKEIFKKLSKRIRGHFYIFGDIRERKDEEQKYYLNIIGLVVHSEISIDVSNKIAEEFRNIWPKNINFPEKYEMKGFEIVGISILIPARYITGVAALVSKDVFTAIKLHEGLAERIESLMNPIPPNYAKMISNLRRTLMFEYARAADYFYKIKNNLSQAREYAKKAGLLNIPDYSIYLLNSILCFIIDRDPISSLGWIKKARKISGKNYIWLYNKAFILMYMEKFALAINDYKKLQQSKFEGEEEIVEQCISFNNNLLREEPEKIQFLFVIGFLQYQKKNNLPLALEYFEKYIQKARPLNKYSELTERATTYLVEIKKSMGLR